MGEWVSWADIVVAATNDHSLNEKIISDAITKGKHYNSADGKGIFIPSTVERPGYTIAISTMGLSPGMSKFIRTELEKGLGPELMSSFFIQNRLRSELKEKVPDQHERERRLWTIINDDENLAYDII